MSLKNTYEKERSEIILCSKPEKEIRIFTEQLIEDLPEPIKNYLRICGYIDKPVMNNADILWTESFIKLSPEKKWAKLETKQFNSINPIARISYMKFLSMPVTGRDIYRNGQGEMKGKLFNIFPIINGKGFEVSQSSLITIFCEFLFIPGYVIQDYVKWEYADNTTIKATLCDKNFNVSGIFHFDNDGFFYKFETDDRFYTNEKRKYMKTRFSAIVDSYQNKDGFIIPKEIRIVWHLHDRDYEYYKGTIERINFNVLQ